MKAAGYLFFLIIFLLLYSMANAQHNHAQFHPNYQNWVNKNGFGCCNNQDCGTLKDEDERTTPEGKVEVRILGQWCPVEPYHYLLKGNAPDWSSAHVCVTRAETPIPIPTCSRLLCYQPRPQS